MCQAMNGWKRTSISRNGSVSNTSITRKKYRVSTSFLLLLLLLVFVIIQLLVFLSAKNVDYQTLSQQLAWRLEQAKRDGKASIISRLSAAESAKKAASGRIVNVYDEEHPLISVEMRAKANPLPPFPPIILTSPYIQFVTEELQPNLSSAKQSMEKIVAATFANGTIVQVGLVDITKAIAQQKQIVASSSSVDFSVQGTWKILEGMGVDLTAPPPEMDDGYENKIEDSKKEQATTEPAINWTAQLPRWGQILENYGTEPVILGLDRCQAYRDAVPPEQRMVGPAGLFSTGTNLFFTLMLFNCLPPPIEDLNSIMVDDPNVKGGRRHKYVRATVAERKRFVQWQAPWGKHNPSEARLHFGTTKTLHVNQSAVFPVVLTRHPYTWMHTICKHSYSARWVHDQNSCDHRKHLVAPVSVRFGSNPKDVQTGKQKRTQYNGVAQFYKQWYAPFFRNTEYPMVMARFEDLVFRPDVLIRKVCDCVGGRMMKSKFSYRQETVNLGPGHGHHGNSGLLPSFVKYGKPLEEYFETYSKEDKKIMEHVFRKDQGFLEAMGYKLFNQ